MVFFIIKSVLICFLLSTVIWVFFDSLYYYFFLIPHYRTHRKRHKDKSLFWHIYHTLPLLIATYIEDCKSDEFKEHGFILFSGKQGQGKTMAMTYYIDKLQKNYPGVIVLTNYCYKNQNDILSDYTQLFSLDNSEKGLIYGFDEVQATFSSRNWKDNFTPDLLSAICQNRKSHRLIYGTCQNIQLVDKSIRLQCMKFAKCYTFFTFLTLVVWFEPEYDFEGNLDKSKFKGFRLFFQTPELRSLYNTFDLIRSIK